MYNVQVSSLDVKQLNGRFIRVIKSSLGGVGHTRREALGGEEITLRAWGQYQVAGGGGGAGGFSLAG